MKQSKAFPGVKTLVIPSLLLALSACGGDDTEQPAPAPPPAPAPAPAPAPVVRVDGVVDHPGNYSADRLRQLPAITQNVSFTSGSGQQSRSYIGASLWSVLSDAGITLDPAIKPDLLNRYVLATAADGYQVAYALAEISPDFANRQSLLAYSQVTNGATKDLDQADGPFRVTAPQDIRGGRYLSNVQSLEVRRSGSTTTSFGGGVANSFTVSGAVTQPVTYDLTALKSMPATTVTVGANSYTGVNLWSLLNATGIKTSTTAHNPTLAMIAVATGSDGFKAVVSLGEINPSFGNTQAIVAYEMNGSDLGKNGVTRLIVPGEVKQGRSVSNLSQIEVIQAAP